MNVRLGGSVAALVEMWWCGAWAEGMLLVSWESSVCGMGEAGLPHCSQGCVLSRFVVVCVW